MKERGQPNGHFEIRLDAYMQARNISKNKLSQKAKLQRTQLNLYCNNKVSRLDLNVLARICSALGCGIGEILMYIPDKEKKE